MARASHPRHGPDRGRDGDDRPTSRPGRRVAGPSPFPVASELDRRPDPTGTRAGTRSARRRDEARRGCPPCGRTTASGSIARSIGPGRRGLVTTDVRPVVGDIVGSPGIEGRAIGLGRWRGDGPDRIVGTPVSSRSVRLVAGDDVAVARRRGSTWPRRPGAGRPVPFEADRAVGSGGVVHRVVDRQHVERRGRVPVGDRACCRIERGQPAQLGGDDAFDQLVADPLVLVDAQRAGGRQRRRRTRSTRHRSAACGTPAGIRT